MKIIKSKLEQKLCIDTSKFKDYAFFIYNSRFYNCFSNNDQPSKLNNDDLIKIDSLINLCIDQNKDRISLKSNDYLKQCIAVINSANEKEVWINCICKENTISDFRYKVSYVKDGGDCYFSLKINLSKVFYYNLSINGLA